jgi:hypothetical protein
MNAPFSKVESEMMAQRLRFATVLVGAMLLGLAFATVAQEGRITTAPGGSTEARRQSRILVAPAVNVSQANSSRPHFEVQIAADPTNTKRLIACSMQLGADDMNDGETYLRPHPNNVAVYASVDGGLSWQPTYTVDKHQQNLDPSCVFGPNGTAYFTSFGGDVYGLMSWSLREIESKGAEKFSKEVMRPFYRMPMYRSTDGAKTWSEVSVQEMVDREYITVDNTVGKYRGRVYVHGLADGSAGIDGSRFPGLAILRSTDRGQTYESVKLADEGTQLVVDIANGIVMSDGTFATIFTDASDKTALFTRELHPAGPNAKLKFVSSNDGGETFGKATVISDWYWRGSGMTIHGMPSLAVDRTDGPFHDRLYAASVDVRSGRGEIRFARSDDKGKTWLPSFVISDNWPRDERGETPDSFLPALAVNRNGVLGVMWYDRRDHPDNLGYDIRFSASLDGGESFLPSVLVSTGGGSALQMKEALLRGPLLAFAKADGRAHAGFTWSVHDYGSDTAGLACDLDGIFHPLWIDRRSGIQQLSTTRVTVNGTAMLNGGNGLQSLGDLSGKTEVRYSLAHLDLTTNEIRIGAAIANTSKEPIPGRITLRLLGLSSTGPLEAQNADNQITTAGAIWEFHTASGEPLQPGALTAPRQLQFKLARRPFPQAPLRSSFDSDLIGIDTKILGNTSVNMPEATKTSKR